MTEPRDYHTSTMDAAAAFARMVAGLDDADLRDSDARDALRDSREPDPEDTDEAPECQCHDPCLRLRGQEERVPVRVNNSFSAGFEVFCEYCGAPLEVKLLPITNVNPVAERRIEVTPCPGCDTETRKAAYNEGYADGKGEVPHA